MPRRARYAEAGLSLDEFIETEEDARRREDVAMLGRVTAVADVSEQELEAFRGMAKWIKVGDPDSDSGLLLTKPQRRWASSVDRRVAARAADLALLAALIADPDLTTRERVAFEDMQEHVAGAYERTLTAPQRDWAKEIADRLGVGPGSPAERNRNVPRGANVPTPAVLSHDALRAALRRRRPGL